MPSVRKKTTKAGQNFYEIRVSRGRGQSYLSTRWYVPAGWSQKAIDKELTKQAAEFERQVKAGEVITREEQRQREQEAAAEAAKIQTLKQYGEWVYMPSKTVSISENSRSGFQRCLDNRIYPALGELKITEITAADISAFLINIQREGLAHASVVKYYTVLHSLFKMAYLTDVIEKNPMDKVERPKPRKGEVKDEVEAYTAEEIRYIMECLRQEPLKWQALVRLLIDTGVRRGEACGLQWSSVHIDDNTITVEANLCYTSKAGIYLDTPKNGKSRTIDVDPEVMELLRRLQAEQREQLILTNFVFTQDGTPEPMHPQSPTRYMTRFAKRYGIKDMHPHKLRHSFASIAITNGADIASVSEKLGHSDKAVTLRMYTHADEESIRRAGQIFRDAIKQKQA